MAPSSFPQSLFPPSSDESFWEAKHSETQTIFDRIARNTEAYSRFKASFLRRDVPDYATLAHMVRTRDPAHRGIGDPEEYLENYLKTYVVTLVPRSEAPIIANKVSETYEQLKEIERGARVQVLRASTRYKALSGLEKNGNKIKAEAKQSMKPDCHIALQMYDGAMVSVAEMIGEVKGEIDAIVLRLGKESTQGLLSSLRSIGHDAAFTESFEHDTAAK